ncbi:E3 ubiquitin ligase PARAQUAT TOLERANCE 3-like isoform X3 [Telopea speciosissima]|uniref:E3 ubiquitin ligase PARAQUAT TOLERANCE 3-like isoform X3 n=1 Tax=Telopea speciosissima TaxID=54955 RepID=UPI001CC64DAA|nr:E3 ubiquitin ligase PARAQUAT TOLERANCE 3-like isoform X3 [Telopea speciosissima]
MKFSEELDLDDFGDDVYAIPKVLPVCYSNPVVDAPSPSETDEHSRIKALVNTPALNWQRQTQKGFCSGRGYGSGTGTRMMLGYGRAGQDQMTPPQGYVCHRCKISGHFIQHCPTNGDPNYDFKRVKPTARPLPVLNEAAFEKEIEGLRSTQSVTNLPPELHCPMCKEVMVDAMLTSKCCFTSFCDRCIRNHIISNSVCFCGATNMLADDLVPNVTLRETINRLLENSGSMKIQGTNSACYDQSKVLSPTISFASSGDKISLPKKDGTLYIKETTNEKKDITNAQQSSLEEGTGGELVTLNKNNMLKELASNEPGKEKKKTCLPVNDGDNQWSTPPDLVPGDCMMPLCSSAYPHGANIPLGMDGYMAYYSGVTSHWGYAAAYFNVPVGGPISQGTFVGHSDSLSHQRDLTERVWISNPIAKRSEPRRKHKTNHRGKRRCSSRQHYDQVNNSVDVSSVRSKLFVVAEHARHNDQFHQAEKSSTEQSVQKVEVVQLHERLYQYQNQDHQHNKAAADRKRKGSELSSTNFTDQDISKKSPREAGNSNNKKQLLCSTETSVSCGQRERRSTLDRDGNDEDEDDDDQNFKRQPSWYRSSLTFQERAIPV